MSEFSTSWRVRYSEIDGQKVVFNARYLDYADVAITEFWEWTGIAEALGDDWERTEFHVRHSAVEYLRPFVWGDTVLAKAAVTRLGGTSLTTRIALYHAETRAPHAVIDLVTVNVHLPSGKPVQIAGRVREFLERLASEAIQLP